MKTCQCCGAEAEDSAQTCPACGEGSWSKKAEKVTEKAPEPEPADEKPKKKGR